jgi:hypothetical protein
MFNKKKKHFFLEIEEGYWIVMIINRDPNETELEKKSLDYNLYKAILHNQYKTFRLFHSTLEKIFKSSDVDLLRKTLEFYFDKNIELIKKYVSSPSIFNILTGLNFLPVDTQTFLSIQSIFNQIEFIFSNIGHIIFEYENYILFTSLKHEEVVNLQKYLSLIIKDKNENVGFLTDFDENNDINVYLEDEEPKKVVSFKYNKFKFHFLVDCIKLDENFYNSLKDFLKSKLPSIYTNFGQKISNTNEYLFYLTKF